MKKVLLGVFFLVSFVSFSQNSDDKEKVKHSEIKLNAFNLLIFGSMDVSYEYLLDSESSIGISTFINLQDREDDNFLDGPYYNEKFAITPYYRRYFSSRYAWGFFLETFASYNVQDDTSEDYVFNSIINDYEYQFSDETSNNFAFGIALGGKFVTKRGFVFEFFGGIGRNIVMSNKDIASDLIPRLGASIGWRF